MSHEKPHLDNARKLRGIYFVDPEDKEFEETIKNDRKKLEIPVAPAMPCKILKNNKNCGSGASNKVKSKLACILEAGVSARLRLAESLPTHHEDHIAGKGDNSLQHYSLVHKFIPMPQAMKRFPIGNAYLYTVKKGYSYLCMWMTKNWLERNKTLIRCANYSTKKSIRENQHLSLIMKTWAALKDNVK